MRDVMVHLEIEDVDGDRRDALGYARCEDGRLVVELPGVALRPGEKLVIDDRFSVDVDFEAAPGDSVSVRVLATGDAT
jgi:hypothetical protein